jgi:predicted DCC family thiol-disulfide oxidoreductase YuxK
MASTRLSRPMAFSGHRPQVRPGGGDLVIENASSLWKEADHPFVSVARITIVAPQENVHSEEHIAKCERLVFTPWHSLAAHQPIGGINRLRKAVYEASANYRLNA